MLEFPYIIGFWIVEINIMMIIMKTMETYTTDTTTEMNLRNLIKKQTKNNF